MRYEIKVNDYRHKIAALDDKGKQIGYLIINMAIDERGPWITGLYIDPQYRHQHIVKDLINIAKMKFGRPLFVKPSPYENDGQHREDPDMDEASLRSMYKHFGFRDYNKGILIYEAKTLSKFIKATPKLYKAYSERFGTKKFNPKSFNLPSNVTEIIGQGSESLVVGSKNPNDPVYKINTHDPKMEHSNIPHTDETYLRSREKTVNAINEIENIGFINIPKVIMFYGAYRSAKDRGETPVLPKEAYYDKESKCFVVDNHLLIRKTNTELLPGGIIKQDRISGKPIDNELYQKVIKYLKSKGYYVDAIGGRRNFLLDDSNRLAIIDGVSKLS